MWEKSFMIGANALAYFATASLNEEKGLITLTLGLQRFAKILRYCSTLCLVPWMTESEHAVS
jgi:hypothetical protein